MLVLAGPGRDFHVLEAAARTAGLSGPAEGKIRHAHLANLDPVGEPAREDAAVRGPRGRGTVHYHRGAPIRPGSGGERRRESLAAQRVHPPDAPPQRTQVQVGMHLFRRQGAERAARPAVRVEARTVHGPALPLERVQMRVRAE